MARHFSNPLNRHVGTLAGLILSFVLASTAAAEHFEIVAYEFAPLQMRNAGNPKGYVIDLVKAAAKRSGVEITAIKFVPWRRAMSIMAKRPNVMFFSISRTPAREDKFIWVGQVSPYELYFYRLKGRADITADTIDAIKATDLKLGVQGGSNSEAWLKKLGFAEGWDYVTYSHYKRGIPMLFNQRFAMMPLTSFVARANVCREGFNGAEIEPVLRIDELSNPLWAVFSRGTPKTLVAKIQKTLGHLTDDGTADRIRSRYLAEYENRSCDGK